MGFKDLMKGTYKVFCKCPNCGFGTEIKIEKGVSVAEHIKGGKCKCDNCLVVFFPEEYTTEHFEKDKRNHTEINLMKGAIKNTIKSLPKPKKEKWDGNIKW